MAEEGRSSFGFIRFIRDLLVIVLVAVLISFLLKTFLIRSFFIPSSSMERTLEVNDRVIVNQLAPNVVDLHRGDVVVFRDPGGWLNAGPSPELTPLQHALQFIGLAPDTSDNYLIKRLIGLPGDHVVCCDANGRMTVNGEPLDEPYAVVPEGNSSVSAIDFDVTVSKGSLWVMGDNRYASKDSRYNQDQPGKGFVTVDEIVGRAFLLNWPLDRLGILGNYPEVFSGVPEPSEAAETED
ncbi:MAG: signal peptidase I [Canibacter sp.]